MRPYQEEYIANIRAYDALAEGRSPEDEARRERLIIRNMELLRGGLLPQLDHLL